MSGRRFWLLHAALPALLFLPLALLFLYTPLDLRLVDPFYDAARGVWVGDGSWWAKDLLHEAGRRLVAAVAMSAFLLWLLAAWVARLRRWREAALYVGVCVLACTALVAALKHYSGVHCPEALLRYGGQQAYARAFAAGMDSAGRGACFPGGHSSGAFSLLAFYFLLRERHRAAARLALAAALALGLAYAAGQWARGEHFPSHDAWSAVICWYMTLGLHAVFRGRATAP